jgi:hypothetical protein
MVCARVSTWKMIMKLITTYVYQHGDNMAYQHGLHVCFLHIKLIVLTQNKDSDDNTGLLRTHL